MSDNITNPEPPVPPGEPAHNAWLEAGGHMGRVPVAEERLVEHYFDMIYAHTITRDQNTIELNKMADKLKDVWTRFDNREIDSQQYLQEIQNFKAVDMRNGYLTDDLTIMCFNETITKLESESNA